jgi:4-hydroxy-3-methylbut-2-enyl diphosphate reductase IspH
MEYTYTEIIHNEEVVGILRNEDKASIPLDPANSDYQAYLIWLEEQNG